LVQATPVFALLLSLRQVPGAPDHMRSSAAPTRLAWEITIKVRHLLLFGLVKNSFKIIG
jgi:hypothetical protein